MSYGRRWQVETTFSTIKRRLGSLARQEPARRDGLTATVNARGYWSRCRAMMLKAVVHNLLILYAPTESAHLAAGWVFCRASLYLIL